MAGINDHEAVNKLDVSVEDGHMLARAFDYSDEDAGAFMETEFVNLDQDAEEMDIFNFVGDLRALMVEDSDDVIVLDSDDEVTSEQKDGKVRGPLWRRVSAVGAQSFELKSSAGSNLTDKVTDNDPNSLQADARYQEVLTGISNDDNVAKVDKDQKAGDNNFENANVAVYESQEPGESTQANALKFVDHFLLISIENSSPEVKIPKVNLLRSPLTSFARGSHDLARKTNLMNQIGISTFDWDGNQPDHGGEFMLAKKKELMHLDGRLSDQHVEEELPKCPPVNDTFDVSFNTQMAAEAIESLLYAAPQTINVDENEDTNKKTLKQFSFPLRDVNQNGFTENQKELHVESSTGNLNNVCDKSLKVETKQKQNQDSKKENIRFRYKRRGSSEKISKRTEYSSNLENITTHGKQVNTILYERKTGDLGAVSGNIKFEAWNWPKKRRTCRNMRQSGIRVSVVGPSEREGNFREAFLMSSVKRKARSASKLRSTDGNKFLKGSLVQKVGQPNLSEVRVWLSRNLDNGVVKQQRKIVKKLGILIAKDCSDATHFVADRFETTKKMLEAMAFGRWVVTPFWLERCEQATSIIDESNYILRDAEKEKEIGFNMPVSLSRARSHPLLKDRRVFITSNVEPDKEMIKSLVKASQGQVMEGVQQASTEYNIPDNLLILSCEKDYQVCVPFLDKGAAVYSSQLLLNGIVIQKLDYARHQLFKWHVKMKRYARKRTKNRIQHVHGGY